MDKEKRDVNVSVSHGGYSACSVRSNVTLLEVINNLCEEANNQNKIIMTAKITMQHQPSIILDNKSL